MISSDKSEIVFYFHSDCLVFILQLACPKIFTMKLIFGTFVNKTQRFAGK